MDIEKLKSTYDEKIFALEAKNVALEAKVESQEAQIKQIKDQMSLLLRSLGRPQIPQIQ